MKRMFLTNIHSGYELHNYISVHLPNARLIRARFNKKGCVAFLMV